MPDRGPRPAADVIVELPGGEIVLIERKNPPFGWAIPGGFIEIGESAEDAAVRECLEETGLEVTLVETFHVYSDPRRDPRFHTLSVVFIGRAVGLPVHGDDAAGVGTFREGSFPEPLAFDHRRILSDYFHYKRTGNRPAPDRGNRDGLSFEDRAVLLAIARQAIEERLTGERPAAPEPSSPRLLEPRGVFVSLHVEDELRGCIGTLGADRPLWRAVREMAQAAAFDDPRFPPLTEEELSGVRIDVSVLSPLWTTAAENVIAGVHGVSVTRGNQKAVFLPQVAREVGWSRDELLSQTCLKAGLPSDAWQDSATQIAVFTAAVFAEERPSR